MTMGPDPRLELVRHYIKMIKSSEYVAPEVPEMTAQSWKMNEYKY